MRVQARRLLRDRCTTPAVHANSGTLRASLRLSMPNTVRVKYSVRVQARGPPRVRCITPAVYAKCGTGTKPACEPTHTGIGASSSPCHKNCTCTSIVCELQHAGLSTIGTSRRLFLPKHSARVTSTVRACKHKHSCILRTPLRLSMPYTVQRTHTRTHAEWYNARAAHVDRRSYTHTHTRYTARAVQAEHRTARTHAENVVHKLQYKF